MRPTARRDEAQRLRAQGWTYPRIAERLGISQQAAHALVTRATSSPDTETVWVRLARDTHERLQCEYEQACRSRGEAETARGFRNWLSERAVKALDA
jgi:DNA-binding transcriptional regulator LsrR (DeoR family)